MVFNTQLKGCHALVTGGTKGMGRAIVEALLEEGCIVSYCARTVTGDEFPSAHAIGTVVDVGDREKLIEWTHTSAEKHGRIDIVVANASAFLFSAEPKDWDRMYAVDLMSFVYLTEAATPWLEKSSQPSVIVLSSIMAREFYKSPPAAYGPLKAAQLQHVQELSHHLGPKGIRVNAISPGPVIFPGGAWETYTQAAPEFVKEKTEAVALKRLGKPQEIAKVAVFLASPLSSFVAGINLIADGGNHVGTCF